METIKDLPRILAFVKVAEGASFSKAAEVTGVSKSHLSKLIKELEAQLNKPLFVRSTRSVQFTDFGRYFFEQCKGHVYEIERIVSQSEEIAGIPEGHIRVTLAGAFGEEVIAPLISRMLLRYPSISADLLFDEKILDLEKDRIDLAIRVSATKPKDGLSTKIGDRVEWVCASETYLKLHGCPQKPSDLKKFNCLVGSKDIWTFMVGGRQQKIKINGRFKSLNGRCLAEAAMAGLGIAKLPTVYIESAVKEGRLIPILQEYTNLLVPIWAVTPRAGEIPLSVKLIVDELQQRF